MKDLSHLTTWFGPHIIELMLDAEAWFKDAMHWSNFLILQFQINRCRCILNKKNIFMESIYCIFSCSAIVCLIMRPCTKFGFLLCSDQQYGKLHKIFVRVKNIIITKLCYGKLQNRIFTLRQPLSCQFQVALLFQVLILFTFG